MVPGRLRPVADPLKLLLVLQQRATALMAEEELVALLSVNENERHTRGEDIAQVHPWDPRILCGRRSHVVRQYVHMVAKKTKAKISQQAGSKHIIGADGHALVTGQGLTRKAVGRQSRTSGDGPKCSQSMVPEVGEAVAAKEVQLFRDIVVDANIEIVVVE